MRVAAVLLSALLTAGCLTAPDAAPSTAPRSETGPSVASHPFLLLETRVTAAPAALRENAPWCAPASYRTDPPQLVLHTPEKPAMGAWGFIVREYGDGETFQHHDRTLITVSKPGTAHVPASFDANVTLIGVRFDAGIATVLNATTGAEIATLDRGDAWSGAVDYTVDGGARAVREDLTLRYVGDVAYEHKLAPCD